MTNIPTIFQEITTIIGNMNKLEFISVIETTGKLLQSAVINRRTIFIAGNGGSWADADHFAGEIRAQFEVPGRVAAPAIALPISLTTLTAWGNDYENGFEGAIERDLEAMSKPGDILIAISTSGKAKNIRRAMTWAKSHKLNTVAISGNGPQSVEFGRMAKHHIIIPHHSTARVQEAYQVIIHILCQYIDQIK